MRVSAGGSGGGGALWGPSGGGFLELVFYLVGLPASSYPTQFLCLRLVGQVPISGWCACTGVLANLLFPLIYLFPTLSTLFLLFPTLPYFQPSYLALLCVST